MNHEAVGTRGHLFTFDDLPGFITHVYLIAGPRHLFVLDTFLGPGAMKPVREFIRTLPGRRPLVVFNSHYHWDHVWGNCAFPRATIIAHAHCRRSMETHGGGELEQHGEFRMGRVGLTRPGVCFDARLDFEDDGVQFFYSPGHTEDSASAWDRVDRVLFAGDNLEMPIPYLTSPDIAAFEATLVGYQGLPAERIIAGHASCTGTVLVEDNLRYLRRFRAGDTREYESGPCMDIHLANLRMVAGREAGPS